LKKHKYAVKVGALIATSNFRNLYFYFSLLFLLFTESSFSASYNINDQTKIYIQEINADSVVLKMDNHFSIPVSVKLELDLLNLEGEESGAGKSTIIPANNTGYVLAKFRKIDTAINYKCSYKWKIVLGDVTKMPDKNYAYGYPFTKSHLFKISQGPGGEFSHKDMFAYDFTMPVGTPVIASRDGIVAVIKANSGVGGPSRKFIDDANYISVYHSDGTIANYLHLNKNGVVVKAGQSVKKGELIGYSGNSGFSSGPHLHFEVVQPALDFEKSKWLSFIWDIKTNNGLFSFLYKKSTSSL
jgi:murein DD-endopeptidase MepM/ murein hydrolase activator NlpD